MHPLTKKNHDITHTVQPPRRRRGFFNNCYFLPQLQFYLTKVNNLRVTHLLPVTCNQLLLLWVKSRIPVVNKICLFLHSCGAFPATSAHHFVKFIFLNYLCASGVKPDFCMWKMLILSAQFKKIGSLPGPTLFRYLLLNFELIICHATIPSRQY